MFGDCPPDDRKVGDLAGRQGMAWGEERLTPRLYVAFRRVSEPGRIVVLGPFLQVNILGEEVLAETLGEDGRVRVVELARREGDGWKVQAGEGKDAPPYPWLRIHTMPPARTDGGEQNGQR